MEKLIGKIKEISFGFGGYDDAMIGITFVLGSDKGSWGVSDFKGTWAMRPENAKWTLEEQTLIWGKMVAWARDLLRDAKKTDLAALKGVPVEAIFEEGHLKSWRILTEVI